jgi:pimeloyl-ACP methyl ester carboxylesterase
VRRLLTLLAAGCLAVAGLFPAAPVSAQAGTIAWGPCSDAALVEAHAQCGFLAVPLDHAVRGGPTIRLALSRVLHTVPAAAYQGVVLVDPGGPGASGLGYATLGARVPDHAGDAYDWIGFDPRGVGSSVPALSCVPDYFAGPRPPYEPTTQAILRSWLTRSRDYAAACGRSGGALPAHMKTTDSVRDMDSIRTALGVSRISYYGFSYGTYLGQVYATMFPSHVRRMVLDSNVDPTKVWYRANLDQEVAFDRNVDLWLGWVAQYDGVYHLGTTTAAVRALFTREETALTGHPARGELGPDEWADAFLGAGYAESLWIPLARAFADWVHARDPTKVIAAYHALDSVGDDNGFAVYNAVQCTDVRWPRSWSTWARDARRINAVAPFFTWGNTWFNAPCLTWPAAAGTPVDVHGDSVAALLVGETLDAATPFSGNLEVRRRFPAASLLGEPGGTTHAHTLSGNACVDDTIARYLATGALPARRSGDGPDATCAPLPRPVPSASGPPSAAPLMPPGLVPLRR